MIRPTLCSLAVSLLLARSAAAQATTFSIDPLLIRLDAQARNAVVTITNTSSKELRFEIKAFAWEQVPPAGESKLTPTSDVAVFPPLVTLKPKSIQRLRVGTTVAVGPMEKAYRIMVEELPSGAAPVAANQVAVRTRIGVPVFLAATAPTVSGRIDPPTVTKGAIRIPLTNTGNTYAMVDSVVVRGMSGPDQVVFEDSMRGWYVLAGQTRTWQYDLKPAQCHALKFVEIEVYAHDKELTSRLDVPAAACTH